MPLVLYFQIKNVMNHLTFLHSVDSVENLTHVDFFNELPGIDQKNFEKVII